MIAVRHGTVMEGVWFGFAMDGDDVYTYLCDKRYIDRKS
jgi:hypothetical protein